MNEEKIKDILSKLGLFKISKKVFGKFLHKYKRYKFEQEADEALKKIKKILDEEAIIFWLEFGTLLGAVRDKDFIKHDFDIDLGCYNFIENKEKLQDKLKENGFNLIRRIIVEKEEKLCEETYSYKNKLNIDFFYFYKEKNEIVFYDFTGENGLSFNSTIKDRGGLVCYKTKISNFELDKYKFKGMEFNIPKDVDAHLKELYGETYLVINPNWTPSMRKNRVKLKEIGKVEKF